MARGVSPSRVSAAHEVSKALRDPERRARFPVQPDGERHILIAAPQERMMSVFRRLESVGLPATVCVRGRNGTMQNVFVREIPEGAHLHDDEEGVLHVHPNITVKMMIEAVWQTGGSGIVHLVEPTGVVDYDLAFA